VLLSPFGNVCEKSFDFSCHHCCVQQNVVMPKSMHCDDAEPLFCIITCAACCFQLLLVIFFIYYFVLTASFIAWQHLLVQRCCCLFVLVMPLLLLPFMAATSVFANKQINFILVTSSLCWWQHLL